MDGSADSQISEDCQFRIPQMERRPGKGHLWSEDAFQI